MVCDIGEQYGLFLGTELVTIGNNQVDRNSHLLSASSKFFQYGKLQPTSVHTGRDMMHTLTALISILSLNMRHNKILQYKARHPALCFSSTFTKQFYSEHQFMSLILSILYYKDSC